MPDFTLPQGSAVDSAGATMNDHCGDLAPILKRCASPRRRISTNRRFTQVTTNFTAPAQPIRVTTFLRNIARQKPRAVWHPPSLSAGSLGASRHPGNRPWASMAQGQPVCHCGVGMRGRHEPGALPAEIPRQLAVALDAQLSDPGSTSTSKWGCIESAARLAVFSNFHKWKLSEAQYMRNRSPRRHGQ